MQTPAMLPFLLKLTCFTLLLLGCSKRLSTDAGQESVTDKYGATYPVRVMKDGKQWLAQNLNINIAGSYCYNDSVVNCSSYGRLYTWASAREACSMLGEQWQ